MRIPLLQADFEGGSYTKIAKALRKIWPLGDQSLMQAQNSLGVVLGYSGLHDAQREATASFSIPDGSLTMEKMVNAVAWRMFVRYGIDLLVARTLVSKLHLHELAVAGITLDRKMRRIVEDAGKKGVFHDEMWHYMNYQEPWPEQTPRLLGKGIPPCKWVIYPNRQVFLWSKLVAQIEMLPEGFADDLRQAGKLGNSPDAADSFMVDSLMPAACQPLTEALASGDLTAEIGGQQQWQVKWIVTRHEEVLGCCIVAEKLGGIIPRVFAPDGSDAYAALANLLCGEVVPEVVTPVTGALVSEPIWFIDHRRLQQLKNGQRRDLLKSLWHHDRWPNTVELYRGAEGCRLAGSFVFSEHGQEYLATVTFDAQEQQRILRDERVFETFDLDAGLLEDAGTEKGIPALGNRWYTAVEQMFSTRNAHVEGVMRTRTGTDTLMAAVLAVSDAPILDAFVAQAIDECLPLRYEGDAEDNEDLVSERQSAVSLAKRLGNEVMASMPNLLPYSALALGYMLLVANGEYPGSRYQSMIDAPAPTDWYGQSRLLATMLNYASLSGRELSWLAMACAIAPVFESGYGPWSREKLGAWYESACLVERRLKEAKNQLKSVEEWRRIEIEADRVRAQGEFLRTGDRIPTKRPKSPAEAFSELYSLGRSAGTSVTQATQAKQEFSRTRQPAG